MGMYCCCGVRMTDEWKCECDWTDWFACFATKDTPSSAVVKKIPEVDGVYEVRMFDDGDHYEDTSEFCVTAKNWGEYTNEAISNWKATYCDGWMGYRGVYAWKAIETEKK